MTTVNNISIERVDGTLLELIPTAAGLIKAGLVADGDEVNVNGHKAEIRAYKGGGDYMEIIQSTFVSR